jgi:hypothetical protein
MSNNDKPRGYAWRDNGSLKKSNLNTAVPKRNNDGLYIVVYGSTGYSSMPVSGDVAERLLKQTTNGYRVPYQYGYNTPTEKKNRGL